MQGDRRLYFDDTKRAGLRSRQASLLAAALPPSPGSFPVADPKARGKSALDDSVSAETAATAISRSSSRCHRIVVTQQQGYIRLERALTGRQQLRRQCRSVRTHVLVIPLFERSSPIKSRVTVSQMMMMSSYCSREKSRACDGELADLLLGVVGTGSSGMK